STSLHVNDTIVSRIGDCLDLNSTFLRLAAILDTVRGKSRRVNSAELILTTFKEGTREDALLSIGRRKKTVRGKK
ncbi:hypothetical protein PFISCL1PPCAC_7038, partial [Pristionchus fissidentatus]